VPVRLHILDALPVNPAGKVLRRVLTEQYGAMEAPKTSQEPGYLGPRNDLERALTTGWATLLGTGDVGVNDDLVALGADSIVFARAAFQQSRDFGVEIRVVELFDHPTVAGQAALLLSRLEQLSDKQAAELLARLDRAGKEKNPSPAEP